MADGSPPSGAGRFRPGGGWSVFVGIAFVVVIAVAVVNSLGNGDGGVLGTGEGDVGSALPRFALADARGPLTGDANVAQRACASDTRPCPADERQIPACDVPRRGAIRSCDLLGRPLVISFWFTKGGDCEGQQDSFELAFRRLRDRVGFLAVNVRDEKPRVRELISERSWTHPVGLDPDGALSNLLRVGGCPTTVFVRPNGRVAAVSLGELAPRAIERRIERLQLAAGGQANR